MLRDDGIGVARNLMIRKLALAMCHQVEFALHASKNVRTTKRQGAVSLLHGIGKECSIPLAEDFSSTKQQCLKILAMQWAGL